MLLSKKITGFFDQQYLWKLTANVLGFSHRHSNQVKIAFKTGTAGWVGP